MFKYRLTKELPGPEGLGGFLIETILETDDINKVKEILQNLSIYIDISNINKKVKQVHNNFIQDVEKNINEPAPDEIRFSPFEYRLPLFDPKNPPDELIFLEIEYYPIEEIKKEIERIIGKNLGKTKVYISKQNNRIVVKQYDKEKQYQKAIANISYDKQLFSKIKELSGLFNKLIEDFN